jgi:hypothetical protein
MRLSLHALSIALLAAGCGSFATQAMAETYYDPTNTAKGNTAGKTSGYELYKTIGCPGRQLLDPPCKEDQPAPTPKPAPVAKPAPAPVPAPAPKLATKAECMANAKPGECYVLIVKDPVYRTETVKKLVKEAGERIEIVPPVYKAVKVRVKSEEVQEVVPAVYQTVKERVMVKPASTRQEIVPAVFEEVDERVMVKPASKKAVEVPAVYEDVTEKKLVRAAYTTWKPGTATPIQKIDEKSGEIFCLVEVPAEYQTVTTRVMKSPASIRYEDIPAEYKTIKKTVLKTPETTRSVPVPAEYADRDVTKLVKPASTVTKTVPVDYEREIMTQVQPATEKRVPVPAEYADVENKVLVSPAAEYCTQILCDVNATPTKISEIQKALQAAGYNAGTSGSLDAQTMSAILAYQKAKGIPHDGYLSLETVKALGVAP